MKKTTLALITLALLTACSSPQKEEKTSNVLASKIHMVKAAQQNVDAINAKTHIINGQTHVKSASLSGASLYTSKCASCHGKGANKSALNASQSIAGWNSSKTEKILVAYQTGNYGGKMKAIMEGQTKPLSPTQIKLLSDYISVL